MAAKQEAPKGFLRDLPRDHKIDFAEREKRRWQISSARGMTRDEFRQGVIINGLKAKEEFVDKLPRIDAEPYDVRRDGLYSSQMDAYLTDFAIDRVKRHTPQDFDPYAAAIIRVIDRTIRERADRQVCSICSCPPNNSIRFVNILTRSKEEPNKAPGQSIRLQQDVSPDRVDKIFGNLAQKDGRKVIKEIVEEDGQKVEIKILVCDGEKNFISAEEVKEVESKIFTPEAELSRMEVPRPERFRLFPEPLPSGPLPFTPNPARVWVSLTPTTINRQARDIVYPAVNHGEMGVPPITPFVSMFRNNRAEELADNNSGDKEGPYNSGKPIPSFSPESLPAAFPYTKPAKPELLPLVFGLSSRPELSSQRAVEEKEENKGLIVQDISPKTLYVEHAAAPPTYRVFPDIRTAEQGKIEATVVARILPEQVGMEAGVAAYSERRTAQEKKEEQITVPLLEISILTTTPMIYSKKSFAYIIGVEVGPAMVDQIQEEEGRIQARGLTESPIFQTRLPDLGQASGQVIEENLENRGNQTELIWEEESGVTDKPAKEGREPKIFLVERFKLSRSHGLIYEKSKAEGEGESLEIKKLAWVVEEKGNQARPAILELDLPKDQNQRLYAFLHFLRQVVKKVFGEDILWARQLRMVRADEPEPVEVIEEIEYYLELLRGSHGQVFAFAN